MSSDLTAMRRNAGFAAKRMSEILSSRLADFSIRKADYERQRLHAWLSGFFGSAWKKSGKTRKNSLFLEIDIAR